MLSHPMFRINDHEAFSLLVRPAIPLSINLPFNAGEFCRL